MNHTYLIMFDYDGVIVDSLNVFADAFIKSCHENGYDGIGTQDQFTALLDGNFYESLGRHGLSKDRIAAILGKRFSEEIQKHIHKIALFEGVAEVLQSLAVRHALTVITSNSANVVQQLFDREGIGCFDAVLGTEVAKSKVKKIQRVMSTYPNLPAYYVGDTRGDMMEGREAGASTVGVTWGWHTEEKLWEANPDFVVHSPAELLHMFEPR